VTLARISLVFVALRLAGCAGVPTYTSQDLAILPCETDVPRFLFELRLQR
jgi:hypothetical protein